MTQIKNIYQTDLETETHFRYYTMDCLYKLEKNEGNIIVSPDQLILALSDLFSFITEGIFCVDLFDYLYLTKNVSLNYQYFEFDNLCSPNCVKVIHAIKSRFAVHFFICKYDCDNIESWDAFEEISEKYKVIHDILKECQDCNLVASERGLVIYFINQF